MPKYEELKALAATRLLEAKSLFNKRLYDGACYLAGYVVELALKARICKTLDLAGYPNQGRYQGHLKLINLTTLLN